MSQALEKHKFTINGSPPQSVDKFNYLGSTQTSIYILLSLRSECMRQYLKHTTNIAQSAGPHRPQESRLSAYHTQNHRFIVGKTWDGRIISELLFDTTKAGPLSSRLKLMGLRRAGHVRRMPHHRIPRIL